MSILITGHSSGFGAALAKEFKKQGKKVFGISRRSSGLVDKECVCDFTNIEKHKDNLSLFIEELPDLEFVFLNAGILGNLGDAKKSEIDNLRQIMEVNVYGHKFLLDKILDREISCRNVVAVSSGAAISAKHGWLEYCISKSALKMLIETYSLENTDTKFLSIAPGLIKTKMQDQIFRTSKEEVPSVSKFHDLYDSMETATEVAHKFVSFLENLKHFKTGDFVDMRKYRPPPSFEEYKDFVNEQEKKVIAVDFDGVVHDCHKGFHDGTLYGEPLPDSLESIRELSKDYTVIIHTVRARSDRPPINGLTGTEQVWEWLRKNKIDDCVKEVTSDKPRTFVYLDDKALRFENWKHSLSVLKHKSWIAPLVSQDR